MKKFGIIGAEDQEIDLLKAFFVGSIYEQAGLKIYDGSIFEKPVVFACAGVGKVNASLCTQLLISKFKAELIINCGIAGAISSDLCILDIVISKKTFQHDFDASSFGYKLGQIPYMENIFWEAEPHLIKSITEAFKNLKQGKFSFDFKKLKSSIDVLTNDFQKSKLLEGVIATGDVFVMTEEQRNKIKKICPETACVEMEGAAISQVASLNKVPFVILRSISDSANKNNFKKITYEEFSRRAAFMATSLILEVLKNYK